MAIKISIDSNKSALLDEKTGQLEGVHYSNPIVKKKIITSKTQTKFKRTAPPAVEVLSVPSYSDYAPKEAEVDHIKIVKTFLHTQMGIIPGNKVLRKMSGMQVVRMSEQIESGNPPKLDHPDYADPILSAPTFDDYTK